MGLGKRRKGEGKEDGFGNRRKKKIKGKEDGKG